MARRKKFKGRLVARPEKREQWAAQDEFLQGRKAFNGEGRLKDKVETLKHFHRAAELGHPDAQFFVGNCYHSGSGLPMNFAEAHKWYRLAAEQGHPVSQWANRGYVPQHRSGFPRELAESQTGRSRRSAQAWTSVFTR